MPGGRRHPPHQGLPRARLTRCGSRAAMVARDGDHRRSRGIDRNDHWLCVEHYLRHRSARRISTCGTIAAKKASLVATWWPRGSRSSVPLGHTDAGHGAHKWKRARLGCRTVHQATLHEHLEEEGWHVAAISRPVRPPPLFIRAIATATLRRNKRAPGKVCKWSNPSSAEPGRRGGCGPVS